MALDPTQGKDTSEMSPIDRRVHGAFEPIANRLGLTVRQRGAIKLAIGVPLAVLWYLLQQFVESKSEWLRLLVPGFPGVLALIGAVEVTSGIPISRIAAAWDSLKGWQRLVLGLLIVLAAMVIIFTVLYLCLTPSA